ncbi:MAG: T9SS type A sorting domain-containing protein [Bacteroidales bacterium]|nr:T9SS type A sorting domain-containing protein [Bacteroidales bacterium]
MDSTDTIVYFQSFTDTNSYINNRIYDTIIGSSVMLFADTDRIYEIVSVNGIPYPYISTIIVTVLPVATISIPPTSIHHVTCPDGAFYPYMDGSFHVSLDNPTQDYDWIDIFNDSTYFSFQAYDSVTLTNLRSGTYHVIAHGTNGCDYHDSVTIEQPEPWGWDLTIHRVDTVCPKDTGTIIAGVSGGTPPYNFTWFYYSDTGQVFMPDTIGELNGIYSGQIYYLYMYDSHNCKARGQEIEYIFFYLFEWVEDSIQILTVNPTVCYGSDTIIEAQSVGYGHYVWHVGDIEDTLNYSTWVPSDSVLIAGYFTPPIIGSTLVSVDFYDQHNCVTHDSVWIEVYDPDVSLTVDASEIFADSAFVVYVSPPGGDLYIDDALLISSIPSVFTVYTDGISVGPHILKYAGTFGGSMGLACDDEISIPIQVETNPFVPDWEYNVSIYPNPATTTLNLSSTGTSDFELSVLDITGKVIKTERMLDQNFVFDVSGLASGIYMLRLVSTDGASKIVKFVKR